VIRSWHSERESPEGWYVNLERPWIRRKHGFDTSDLALDIEVEDDLSHWTLKDEDELDVAREAGVLDADDVDAVKREANRVGRLIDERRWPFRTDAEVWRALSEAGQWPIAKLPAGWDLAPPSSVP
jgi:predicted RNA-binding protein associated with RNAse of E/G family